MQRPGDFLKNSDVELISLIQGMLEYKMDHRFSINDVLKHPWCQHKQATPKEAR
jgi:serine/threonine protein kinase